MTTYGPEAPIEPKAAPEPEPEPTPDPPRVSTMRTYTTEVRVKPPEDDRMTLAEMRAFVTQTEGWPEDTRVTIRRVDESHVRGESYFGEAIARHVEYDQ